MIGGVERECEGFRGGISSFPLGCGVVGVVDVEASK